MGPAIRPTCLIGLTLAGLKRHKGDDLRRNTSCCLREIFCSLQHEGSDVLTCEVGLSRVTGILTGALPDVSEWL